VKPQRILSTSCSGRLFSTSGEFFISSRVNFFNQLAESAIGSICMLSTLSELKGHVKRCRAKMCSVIFYPLFW
jgi:hypothetical protein